MNQLSSQFNELSLKNENPINNQVKDEPEYVQSIFDPNVKLILSKPKPLPEEPKWVPTPAQQHPIFKIPYQQNVQIVQNIHITQNIQIIQQSYLCIPKTYKNNSENREIRIINGKNHKQYGTNINNWNPICEFNDCFNFSLDECNMCSKHKNGVEHVKNSSTDIGLDQEVFIYDLLLKSNELINVTNIGQENCKLDIIYQVKDEVANGFEHFRGIQIKTLSRQSDENSNAFQFVIEKYDVDTLIVGVSENKDHFCLFDRNSFGIDKRSFYINLDTLTKENVKYIFTSETKESFQYFVDSLIYNCRFSTIYSPDQFSSNNFKEKKMMDDLKFKCKEHNLEFSSNKTSDSSIDCFINGKSIQCKYSTRIKGDLYSFSLFHSVNNKLYLPYSETDNIDYFIFMHSEDNSFRIIHTSVLIHFGYIKTSTQNGKTEIKLAYLSYQQEHWTTQFIDNFDILKTISYDNLSLLNINKPFDKFQLELNSRKIKYIRNIEDLKLKSFIINDKLIKFIESNNFHEEVYAFSLCCHRESYNICNTNVRIPDVFILHAKGLPDNFYFITKEKLYEKKIIGDSNNKGVASIGLPLIHKTRSKHIWIHEYANRYDLLL